MQAPPLPPGWQAQWHEEYQRFSYVNPDTGVAQWEEPAAGLPGQAGSPEPQAGSARAGARSKRAYAASDMYYGGSAAPASSQAFAPAQPGGGAPQAGTGFFSPAAATSTPDPYAAQTSAPYLDASNRGDLYGQQQQQPMQPGVNAMTQQFGNMGFGNTQQQPQAHRPAHPVNLTQTPTNPIELLYPPPEPLLPPNASFSLSPYKNADVSYQRCTMNAVPTTSSLLNKSKIPMSLICTPYRTVKDGEPEVPVVGDFVIARCRRCRTYINPYVTFLEGGNRWKCCMCNLTNDVPQLFDWDQNNNCPADRWQRAELNHGVVDFVAPTEYMVRPPQPPLYVFVFDVSYQSVNSGVLATAARALLESLDRLPNKDGRTKVAIIGMDAVLHFFKLTEGNPEPTVHIVGDVDDVFLPSPTDLLVSLTEAREGLENLLSRLHEMYKDNHSSGCALGPALQAAYQMISNVGGKVFVLTSNLPNAGPGALKNREDSKLYNTAKESTLLQPAIDFYKKLATDCSRQQVSVDMWLFGSGYTDVATLSTLPKYTGGQTYYYKGFTASSSEDALKFAHEFSEVITQPFLLEAVLRVRASRGLRMAAYHGNAFVRSTDLLALSTVSHDQAYSVEIQIEDPIAAPFVVFQTAVLHTTSFGERRIRVVTSAYPTTTNMVDIYSSLDQVALATFLSHKAVERALSHKLEDARDALMNKVVEIFTVYKNNMSTSGASPHLNAPECLKYLPLLVLGLLKHVAFRQSGNILSDLRAYAQALLTTLPPDTLIPYIHPTFYSLHNMPRECGTVGDEGVILPPPLPLSSERLERHGLHLMEDGQVIFLWVGREAVPQLIQDVFDVPTVQELKGGKATLPLLDNEFSERVNAIIGKIRESRKGPYYPLLYIVKEDGDPSLRMWALSFLIEDRTDGKYSYPMFLNAIKDKVNGS